MHSFDFVSIVLEKLEENGDSESCGLPGILALSKKRAVPSLLSVQTYKFITLLKWGIFSDLFNKISNTEIIYSTRWLNNKAGIILLSLAKIL